MPSQSTHSLTKNQKKKLKKKKRKAAVRAGTSEASQDTDSPVAHSSGPADSSTTEQSGNLQGDGAQSDGQTADSYNGRCEMPYLGTRVKHNLKAGARGPALCQHMHCRLALSVRGMFFSGLQLAHMQFPGPRCTPMQQGGHMLGHTAQRHPCWAHCTCRSPAALWPCCCGRSHCRACMNSSSPSRWRRLGPLTSLGALARLEPYSRACRAAQELKAAGNAVRGLTRQTQLRSAGIW